MYLQCLLWATHKRDKIVVYYLFGMYFFPFVCLLFCECVCARARVCVCILFFLQLG